MTFDDDFIMLEFDGGTRRMPCLVNKIDWPPPAKMDIAGFAFERISFSQITDQQRKRFTHVMRGSVYRPALKC